VASDAGELENVAPETRAVLEAFPGARLLAGAEATAGRLLELCRHAPWIHFAGHGIYRADAPQHSGLRLADRWVLAGELAGMSLRARWIALSACQTARALVEPGEEWFGLARGLLLAGARRVLAAQWDVADEAAARLMAGIYGRLHHGATLPAALRGAQAEAARAGAHPLDWAGFVLLGSPLPAPGEIDGSGFQIPAVPDEHLV
jgi:CHAT domain-containing protein